jgi:hypothetical protein
MSDNRHPRQIAEAGRRSCSSSPETVVLVVAGFGLTTPRYDEASELVARGATLPIFVEVDSDELRQLDAAPAIVAAANRRRASIVLVSSQHPALDALQAAAEAAKLQIVLDIGGKYPWETWTPWKRRVTDPYGPHIHDGPLGGAAYSAGYGVITSPRAV